MSRHKCSVNCFSSVATSFWCRDLIIHYTELNSVATSEWCRDIMSSSSSIPGCLTLSSFHAQLALSSIMLHLRLELCSCNLNMHFDCFKSFTTSNSLILLCFSCCNFLQPIISLLLSHILLLLLQFLLSFEFSTAQQIG